MCTEKIYKMLHTIWGQESIRHGDGKVWDFETVYAGWEIYIPSRELSLNLLMFRRDSKTID